MAFRTSFDDSRIGHLFASNRRWSEDATSDDPKFFERHAEHQHPEFLWIGCSDSRVPAEQVLGTTPGHVFVQRNVGNQVLPEDMNVMSSIEYAVLELKVGAVLVCGHYRCGAVKAALAGQAPPHLPTVGAWIQGIVECKHIHEEELGPLTDTEQHARLCELNVLHQVLKVCSSNPVKQAWGKGQPLEVYGLIYDVVDGHLKPLVGPIASPQDVGQRCFEESLEDVEMKDQDGSISAEDMRKRRAQQVASRYGLTKFSLPPGLLKAKHGKAQHAKHAATKPDTSSGSDEEGSYHPAPVVPNVFTSSSLYAPAPQ